MSKPTLPEATITKYAAKYPGLANWEQIKSTRSIVKGGPITKVLRSSVTPAEVCSGLHQLELAVGAQGHPLVLGSICDLLQDQEPRPFTAVAWEGLFKYYNHPVTTPPYMTSDSAIILGLAQQRHYAQPHAVALLEDRPEVITLVDDDTAETWGRLCLRYPKLLASKANELSNYASGYDALLQKQNTLDPIQVRENDRRHLEFFTQYPPTAEMLPKLGYTLAAHAKEHQAWRPVMEDLARQFIAHPDRTEIANKTLSRIAPQLPQLLEHVPLLAYAEPKTVEQAALAVVYDGSSSLAPYLEGWKPSTDFWRRLLNHLDSEEDRTMGYLEELAAHGCPPPVEELEYMPTAALKNLSKDGWLHWVRAGLSLFTPLSATSAELLLDHCPYRPEALELTAQLRAKKMNLTMPVESPEMGSDGLDLI